MVSSPWIMRSWPERFACISWPTSAGQNIAPSRELSSRAPADKKRFPFKHGSSLPSQTEVTGAFILVISLFTSIAAGGGCASIQVADAATGLPRVIGCGSVTNIAVASGTLCRIRSPGFSLRLHPYAPGLTLGWHETLLFLAKEAKEGQTRPRRPVALRTRNYGIGVSAYCVMIGGDSTFGVYAPAPGDSFVQTIYFIPGHLTNTIITKDHK